MLYIISFQSISCREASPTSPRPHAAPQEGVSIGHPLNLPPGFPHVAQLCPLAGPSKQFSSRPERRSSPRPPCPQAPQCHPGVAKPSSIIPSPRRPCPEGHQSHPCAIPAPSLRYPCAIPAPSSRYPRTILALSPRHPRTIPALSPRHPSLASRSSTECWPIRGLFHGYRGAHWVLQSVFGTATLPTGAS